MTNTCSVCRFDNILINICDQDKPESYASYICTHTACQNCLQEHVIKHLENGNHIIKCLDNSCIGLISYYDIKRIDASLAIKYQTTLKNLSEERGDPSTWTGCEIWESEKPVQCPVCFTYIYRWEGCEIIYCICGSTFCSDCGKTYVTCSCPIIS